MPYFTYSGRPLPDCAVNKCKPQCPFPAPPPPPPKYCPPPMPCLPPRPTCTCCAPIVANPKPPLPGYDYTPAAAQGSCPSCASCSTGSRSTPYGGGNIFKAGDLLSSMAGLNVVNCDNTETGLSDFSNARASGKSRHRRNRTLMEGHPSLTTDMLVESERMERVAESEAVRVQPRKKLRKAEPVCTDCCQDLLLVIGEGMETATSGAYDINLYDYTLRRGAVLDYSANTAQLRVKETGRYRVALSGRFIAEDPDSAHGIGAHIELQDQSRNKLRVVDAENFAGDITRDEFTLSLSKNDVIKLIWKLENVNQTVGLAEPLLFIEKLPN